MNMNLAVFFVMINMIAVVVLATSPFVFFSIYSGDSQFLSEITKIIDLFDNPNKPF